MEFSSSFSDTDLRWFATIGCFGSWLIRAVDCKVAGPRYILVTWTQTILVYDVNECTTECANLWCHNLIAYDVQRVSSGDAFLATLTSVTPFAGPVAGTATDEMLHRVDARAVVESRIALTVVDMWTNEQSIELVLVCINLVSFLVFFGAVPISKGLLFQR